MRTSHKLTRLILALMTLVVLSTMALAQAPANVQVSDQKAGSLLVFPYYYHSAAQATRGNTRISITNTGPGVAVVPPAQTPFQRVHVFLMDGSTCAQADLFVCLTANATATFTTSDYDPERSGYVIAVAVNEQGLPVQANVLIGNAFVSRVDGNLVYEGNYGAESFWRNRTTNGTLNADGTTTINFGNDYDGAPNQFAIEVQHPSDAIGQRIVTAGLNGNLATGTLSGCAQVGTGQAYNQDEKFGSFQGFLTGGCLCGATGTSGLVRTDGPRVPGGLLALFGPRGRSGSLKFNVTGAVGLIMTPRLLVPDPANPTNLWTGIRTLHKTRVAPAPDAAGSVTLTIPVFTPVC